MTETKQPRGMGHKEFIEVAATLEPKLRACADVSGRDKVDALEVLQAVCRSVKVNGTPQHGIKKIKLKAALRVYSSLAADREHNTEQEQAVLDALVTIAAAGALPK